MWVLSNMYALVEIWRKILAITRELGIEDRPLLHAARQPESSISP